MLVVGESSSAKARCHLYGQALFRLWYDEGLGCLEQGLTAIEELVAAFESYVTKEIKLRNSRLASLTWQDAVCLEKHLLAEQEVLRARAALRELCDLLQGDRDMLVASTIAAHGGTLFAAVWDIVCCADTNGEFDRTLAEHVDECMDRIVGVLAKMEGQYSTYAHKLEQYRWRRIYMLVKKDLGWNRRWAYGHERELDPRVEQLYFLVSQGE